MTKIKNSKYKVLRQHYINLWNSDKRGVKVLRRILLLRIFMQIVESKRWLLKTINTVQIDKKYTGRSMYRVNTYISQRLEKMLQFIPDTYIDLNTKTRVFKYIKRKSIRRFGSVERIFFDLIRILEKEKDKGLSKFTAFRVYFRRKQLLQSYYGNIKVQWLRQVVRQYKLTLPESTKPMLHSLLESRLDNIIHNIGKTSSVFHAQQLINHGFIKVNNVIQQTTNRLLVPGDVINKYPSGHSNNSKIGILSNLFDLHYLFKVESQNTSKKTIQQFHKSLNPFVNKTDGLCYFYLFSSFLEDVTASCPLQNYNSLYPAWDILEQTARYKKIKKNQLSYWKYLLYMPDLKQYVYIERPQHFNYPFYMDNYAMRLFAMHLHR
jgi:ribosomal protein S4